MHVLPCRVPVPEERQPPSAPIEVKRFQKAGVEFYVQGFDKRTDSLGKKQPDREGR